tara:strand:- start:5953 stop:6924 length:972 start_codon:yes stop_codon:yes gene_type:complete
MALGNKTSKKFYVTSGGGNDEINASRKAIIDSAFDADMAKGSPQLIDDQTFGPLVFNIQRMQDDLDEVRRFIVASEPKVGSTFDATTDFTVGTTEVYDGGIRFTPSPGDTAVINATANGVLNITTVDAASNVAHLNITTDGMTNIDAATEIVLDVGEQVTFKHNGATRGNFAPSQIPAGGLIFMPLFQHIELTTTALNQLSSANSNKGLEVIPGIAGLSIIVQNMVVVTTMDSSTQQTVNYDAFLTYDGVKNPNECIYYYRRWMYQAPTGYANQEEWRMYRGIQVVAPRTPVGTSVYFTSSSNPTAGSFSKVTLLISYIMVKN